MAKRKNKYTGWKVFLFLLITSGIVMAGLAGYDWFIGRRAHFIRYPEFGIDIPVSYPIHGIDVSRYQNVIDWESVNEMEVNKIRIHFAFIKATEGLGDEDALFARNWKKTKDAGITRGAYHYFLATKSGKAQAENFINSVTLVHGDMPPVLDIEQTYGVPPEKMRERAKEFLETVRAYYGVTPIIYTYVDFYRQFLKDEFDQYPLWVAHYLQKERPLIYRDWTFWQHSEGGRVNGIVTRVDFNVFNGDSTEFSKILVN
jgi:lysozyme